MCSLVFSLLRLTYIQLISSLLTSYFSFLDLIIHLVKNRVREDIEVLGEENIIS